MVARHNNLVVCSHLTRSVESARALGIPEVYLMDPLFTETAIPYFASGSLSLPVTIWILLLRALWLFGFSRNGESLPEARRRAKQAAAKLIALAEEHGGVLLVGHGFINHFIAKELRRVGWHGPSKPDNRFWGDAVYEKVVI